MAQDLEANAKRKSDFAAINDELEKQELSGIVSESFTLVWNVFSQVFSVLSIIDYVSVYRAVLYDLYNTLDYRLEIPDVVKNALALDAATVRKEAFGITTPLVLLLIPTVLISGIKQFLETRSKKELLSTIKMSLWKLYYQENHRHFPAINDTNLNAIARQVNSNFVDNQLESLTPEEFSKLIAKVKNDHQLKHNKKLITDLEKFKEKRLEVFAKLDELNLNAMAKNKDNCLDLAKLSSKLESINDDSIITDIQGYQKSSIARYVRSINRYYQDVNSYTKNLSAVGLLIGLSLMAKKAHQLKEELGCGEIFELLVQSCDINPQLNLMTLTSYPWLGMSAPMFAVPLLASAAYGAATLIDKLRPDSATLKTWFSQNINTPFLSWYNDPNRTIFYDATSSVLKTVNLLWITGLSLARAINFVDEYAAQNYCGSFANVLKTIVTSNYPDPNGDDFSLCDASQLSIIMNAWIGVAEFASAYSLFGLQALAVLIIGLLLTRYYSRQEYAALAGFSDEDLIEVKGLMRINSDNLTNTMKDKINNSDSKNQKFTFTETLALEKFLESEGKYELSKKLQGAPLTAKRVKAWLDQKWNTAYKGAAIGVVIGAIAAFLPATKLANYLLQSGLYVLWRNGQFGDYIQVAAPCSSESVYGVFYKNLSFQNIKCDAILTARTIAAFVGLFWTGVSLGGLTGLILTLYPNLLTSGIRYLLDYSHLPTEQNVAQAHIARDSLCNRLSRWCSEISPSKWCGFASANFSEASPLQEPFLDRQNSDSRFDEEDQKDQGNQPNLSTSRHVESSGQTGNLSPTLCDRFCNWLGFFSSSSSNQQNSIMRRSSISTPTRLNQHDGFSDYGVARSISSH
ncbi:MAG: hypothetical protein KIT27_05800 [Legionellales bacterium]|nr:hypothetical protein [Legionellales bacterium]